MADRTPPFCCQRILPQPPFHKQEHYPRSYTCLLDFLHATSFRASHLSPTNLTKPLTEHDFVVRVCKGHTNTQFGASQFGANQWGAARYFLPDSSTRGSLVEILDVENGDQSGGKSLDSLRGLLSEGARGGKFGGFVYLEDVWMTVLCPVHRDAVWFLQFWVKGPKDSEDFEEVKKRVRGRRNGELDFVEDGFTVRLNEMMGISSRRPHAERAASPKEDERQPNPALGGIADVDAKGWQDHTGQEEQRDHFHGGRLTRYPKFFGPSPSIPPGFPPQFVRQRQMFGTSRTENSGSPSVFNPGMYLFGGNGMFEPREARPRDFSSRNQPHPFGAVGDPVLGRGHHIQRPPPGFLGAALQWEDPSLRAPFTPQPFNLQPPPGFPFEGNQRPASASAGPSRAQIEHWQATNFHSPQPARQFDVGGMWHSPELPAAQPAWYPDVLSHQGPGWGPGAYEGYRPEPSIPPPFPNPQNPGAGPKNNKQGGWEDMSHQAPFTFKPPRTNYPSFSPPPPSSSGNPLDPNNQVCGIPGHNLHEHQAQSNSAPTAPAPLRDTSAAGQSAYAPPAGNTTGLRPIQRRTWDLAKKEWRTYWVWAL